MDRANEDTLRGGRVATAGVIYTPSPAKGTYTNCSTGSQPCSSFGTLSAGLRSTVVAQTGDYFKIRIERCTSGQTFGALGDAYINAASVCGTRAGKASIISASYYYIDVEFWATFSTGSVNFWPVVVLKNGVKMFGNPVLISAPVIGPNFPETGLKDNNNNPSASQFANSQNNVFAKSNTGQCTWYVYGRVQELANSGYLSNQDANTLYKTFGINYTSGRNAKEWPRMMGGTWRSTAKGSPLAMAYRKKGLIVVWNISPSGHVGFIEEVNADKTQYCLSDFNRSLDAKYKKTWYSFDGTGPISGYYPSFYELTATR